MVPDEIKMPGILASFSNKVSGGRNAVSGGRNAVSSERNSQGLLVDNLESAKQEDTCRCHIQKSRI